MRLYKKITDIQQYTCQKKQQNQRIGFVPTMGALHKGHLNLVQKSRELCDITVVSIFVNPAQFNDKTDLEKYPRTIEKDIQSLINAGCDALFYPEVGEMYPPGEPAKFYDLGTLEELFEGASRPGHFQGVCQVVDKLFSMVSPDKVFFGQKDYQQCLVIKKLISLTPGFHHIDMQIIPTLREEDGLAMSSRNMRLTEQERKTAATLSQVLQFINEHIKPGSLIPLLEEADERLRARGFKTDYIALADTATLAPVSNWDGRQPLVALVAAFLGNVRLIDNVLIS